MFCLDLLKREDLCLSWQWPLGLVRILKWETKKISRKEIYPQIVKPKVHRFPLCIWVDRSVFSVEGEMISTHTVRQKTNFPVLQYLVSILFQKHSFSKHSSLVLTRNSRYRKNLGKNYAFPARHMPPNILTIAIYLEVDWKKPWVFCPRKTVGRVL